MSIIRKYILPMTWGTVKMIKNSKIVHAKVVDYSLKIYAIVDEEESEEVERTFNTYGNDELIPSNFVYITTVFEGICVFHIFEEIK